MKSTVLSDESLLKERSLVIEKLWQAIESGIFPLQKFSHVLKEHDLNCWLNFYRLFRPDDLGEFMKLLKQNANRYGSDGETFLLKIA